MCRKLIFIFFSIFLSIPLLAICNPIPFKPKPFKKPPLTEVEEKKEIEKEKFVLTFDEVETISPDVYKASGNVRYESKEILLTCDTLIYDKTKETIHAVGNVAVDFKDFTISGNMLDYNTKDKTGSVYDAMGQEKNGDYTVVAKVIRKTGEDWYEVEEAIFTSCNAALPPWSLKVSKGRFHIDHYAFLNNPRFRVRNFPVIYSPYIIWPIKPDRSTGFLLPSLGSSNTKGVSIGTAFYYAPADFWDSTLFYDYYEKAGNGFGVEFRYAMTERNYGYLSGYYIKDRLSNKNRWYFNTGNTGKMGKKWNYLLDVNLISDANFFRDFERDYSRGTKGNFDSFLFLTRKLLDGNLNLVIERGVEYYNYDDRVVEKALPKVEFRLPQTKMKKRIYFSLQTSFTQISKEIYGMSDVSYNRLDLYPRFEAPLFTPPYIDIIPSLEIRETYYTEGTGNGEEKESLLRSQVVCGLNISGPRLFKKYRNLAKHVIEPFAEIKIESTKNSEGYYLYDEIDVLSALGDEVRYGIRNRFYSKDRRLVSEMEISQTKSLDEPLTFVKDKTSKLSPLLFSFKYWPKKLFSFDLKLLYHPVTERIEDRIISLSFSTPKKEQFFRLSYYYSNNPSYDPSIFKARVEELMLNASLRVLNGKCTLQPHIERDLADNRWRNARVIFWYHGSCYNIGFEGGRREIGFFRDTSFRILVSLKQVGTVVDLFGGSEKLTE